MMKQGGGLILRSLCCMLLGPCGELALARGIRCIAASCRCFQSHLSYFMRFRHDSLHSLHALLLGFPSMRDLPAKPTGGFFDAGPATLLTRTRLRRHSQA